MQPCCHAWRVGDAHGQRLAKEMWKNVGDGSLLEDGDEIKGLISPCHVHGCYLVPVSSGSIGHVVGQSYSCAFKLGPPTSTLSSCASPRGTCVCNLATGCHEALVLHVSIFRFLFPRATFARDPVSSILRLLLPCFVNNSGGLPPGPGLSANANHRAGAGGCYAPSPDAHRVCGSTKT